MKRILLILAILIVVSSQQAFAMRTEIIGGVRNGLALGLIGDEPINGDFSLRFGAEVTTGHEGLILLAGGKFLMTYIGERSPLYLGAGLVGYVGTEGTPGFSLSMVIDRLFGTRPLFMEAGADFVANNIKLQLQLGYKI